MAIRGKQLLQQVARNASFNIYVIMFFFFFLIQFFLAPRKFHWNRHFGFKITRDVVPMVTHQTNLI